MGRNARDDVAAVQHDPKKEYHDALSRHVFDAFFPELSLYP